MIDLAKVRTTISYDAWALAEQVFPNDSWAVEAFVASLDWQLEDGGTLMWFSADGVYDWFTDRELATFDAGIGAVWSIEKEEIINWEELPEWDKTIAIIYSEMSQAFAEVFGPEFDVNLY